MAEANVSEWRLGLADDDVPSIVDCLINSGEVSPGCVVVGAVESGADGVVSSIDPVEVREEFESTD